MASTLAFVGTTASGAAQTEARSPALSDGGSTTQPPGEGSFALGEASVGFMGLTGGAGPQVYVDPRFGRADTGAAVALAARGGAFTGLFFASGELGVRTAFPPGATGAAWAFQGMATAGYYFPLGATVFWPLRLGVGAVAGEEVAGTVQLIARADPIGVSFQVDQLLVDVLLPSVQMTTEFSDEVTIIVQPGLALSYIFDPR